MAAFLLCTGGESVKKIVGILAGIVILALAGLWAEQNYHVSELFPKIGQAAKTSKERFISEIREGMLEREEHVTVKLLGNPKEIEQTTMEALDEVFLIDNPETSEDFDYLRYHYAGMSAKIKGYGAAFKVEYQFKYLDTREEAKAVSEEVKRVLEELNIEKLDDYEKIKIIHDYIIDNTEYDLSVKSNSAYGALINRVSACQGYAALAYKMMTEAGIECRIISGIADQEPHAWNIVKLDGLWYNIDCTWDDPVGVFGVNRYQYDYFLKSNADFKDHKRDKEYDTDEFNLRYAMSGISWKNNEK